MANKNSSAIVTNRQLGDNVQSAFWCAFPIVEEYHIKFPEPSNADIAAD